MSMLSKQREICRKAFFSSGRLAEQITYNGTEIYAVVEIGTEGIRSDWNEASTQVERAGLVDLAIFTVCKSDLAVAPEEGDWIVYNGVKYKAINPVLFDSQANAYVIQAMKDGRAYGGRTYRR